MVIVYNVQTDNMQEQNQIEQEEFHHSDSSNQYGYPDFNWLCSSAYTNTGCCMMDTSFDDTAETIPLFGSSSIITTTVSNDDDDNNDDDNNNNNNNNINNKFEQLEKEFQIMTSKLQTNIAKLSFMNKEKINTNNDYDSNKNLLPFLHDTDAIEVEIEKQLADCKNILKQLWNECKEEKGNAPVVMSSSSENEENEMMDHVHQFSLYKIQWGILRSEYEHHKKQTNFLLSISIR